MSTTDPIIIPIDGDPRDFIADAKKVQDEMDMLKHRLEKAGVSQSAYNQAVANNRKLLDEQTGAMKQSTMSLTDIRSAYMIAADVARVAGQVWEETGQKFVDNAVKVGDMARALGTTTEEASRLKEAADDVGISTESLTVAFRTAQKDGFSPTVEGLAKMSDEYLKLAPGVERTQFLLDRFGKSGGEMGKLLDKGSAAIRKNAAAIEESMIVTQEAYEQARKYQISVDALSDSWDAFTYRVAPPLISALTKVLEHTDNHARALEIMKEQGLSTYHAMGTVGYAAAYKLADAEREAAAATNISAAAAETASGAFETEAEAAKRAEDALKDMTAANKDWLGLVGDMAGEIEGHVEKLHDIRDANAELQDKKQELIDQGYTPESEAIRDINAKIDEGRQKYEDATAEFELNGRRRILSMLEQQLSIDGLDARETDYLLSKGLEWGVYSEAAVRAAQAAMEEVALLSDEISKVPTEHTTTFNLITNGAPPNLDMSSGGGNAPVGTRRNSHAAGGSFVIPHGYGNEGFMMGGGDTASGGERIKITPAGKSGNEDIIAALWATRIDYAELTRSLIAASQQGMK